MNEKKYPIGDLMKETMDHIHAMVDVNTIVGEPIVAGEVTLIPVSRVSAGFGCGGADFGSSIKPEKESAMGGGGGGAGVNIDPIAFVVVRGDTVRILPLLPPADGVVGRVVDMVPEVLDKITDFIEKQQEKKDSGAF